MRFIERRVSRAIGQAYNEGYAAALRDMRTVLLQDDRAPEIQFKPIHNGEILDNGEALSDGQP